MKRERGFTLIEVLVAMSILSVGLLAVLKMSFIYVQANAYNHLFSEAAVVAQDKMEELRSYAASDRVDRYAVFDFDYMVNKTANFTTVRNPVTGTDIAVHGLLSGGPPGGSTVTVPWGVVYEVMYDNATHGDVTAGDGIYTNEDDTDVLKTAGTPLRIHRVYTIQPDAGLRPNYAMLTVTTSWTDKNNILHTNNIVSCINRRQ